MNILILACIVVSVTILPPGGCEDSEKPAAAVNVEEAKEDTAGEGRGFSDMVPSADAVKEAGKVAGVLFLDSIDAAKDVSKRRLDTYLNEERKSERQERNIMNYYRAIVNSQFDEDVLDFTGPSAEDEDATGGGGGGYGDPDDMSHIVYFHGQDEDEDDVKEDASVMERMLRLLGFTKRNSIWTNLILFLANRFVYDARDPDEYVEEMKERRRQRVEQMKNRIADYVDDGEEYRSLAAEEGYFAAVKHLIEQSQVEGPKIKEALLNRQLPEHIIEKVKRRYEDTDTSCVQLFICRMAPVIWGVQDSVNNLDDRSFRYNLWMWTKEVGAYMPSAEDFGKVAPECDKKFPKCGLVDFAKFVMS